MNSTDKIWALQDGRMGNDLQALSLAESFENSFEIKEIKYNFLAKLPNCILSTLPIHIKCDFLKKLDRSNLPDVIISSGRRSASVAVYLKKIKPEIKIIQIMRPLISDKYFWKIILPEHDQFFYHKEVFTLIKGALNNIENRVKLAQPAYLQNFQNKQKFITVMLGGDTKKHKVKVENYKLLIDLLKKESAAKKLPIFLSYSRRTPERLKEYFNKNLESLGDKCKIYDPNSSDYNPYPAILEYSEYIIAPIDSISMCSEAASMRAEKNVFVFSPFDYESDKHKKFLLSLAGNGYVRQLNILQGTMDPYKRKRLDELSKIVQKLSRLN